MFAKLFKHEFLATWRTLATVVGVVFGVSVTLMIPAWFDVPMVGGLGRTLALFGFMSGGVIVTILLAVNYWRTMYSGPGYFTHSLPVRGGSIFAAKIVYANLAALVGWVLGVGLAILVTGRSGGGPIWAQMVDAWNQAVAAVGTGRIWLILILILVYYGALYTVYLCAITFGTRGFLGRLGAGGVVISLVVAYIACQLLASITLMLVPLGIRVLPPGAGTLAFQSMLSEIIGNQAPAVIGIAWVPAIVLLAVVACVAAVRSVERHTNLL